MRSRSTAEVRRKLASAGYRPDLVEKALSELAGQGYLDDETFARAWVESRDRARPRGERALWLELAQKGVPREIIEATLAERASASVPAQRVEEGAAARLLERRRRSLLREPDPARRRQSAYALLARNGFDPDVCRAMASSFVAASLLPDAPDAE